SHAKLASKATIGYVPSAAFVQLCAMTYFNLPRTRRTPASNQHIFRGLPGLSKHTSGFACAISSFSGRSAIIFQMRKVFLRLAAAPASCLQGFAKRFPGRGSWAATFSQMDSPLPKHVYRAWI